MKFSLVAKGTRAEQAASFKHYGADVATILRPLSAAEEIDADADAIKIAKTKGAEANVGSPVFMMARMAAILLRGCVDPESPADARTPTFDGGVPQILELDPDTLAHLYERHQLHQEQVSPTYLQATVSELFREARKLSEDDDPLAFARYARDFQLKLARFMAVLLRSARVFNSSSGKSATSAVSASSEEKTPSPSAESSKSPTTSKATPES